MARASTWSNGTALACQLFTKPDELKRQEQFFKLEQINSNRCAEHFWGASLSLDVPLEQAHVKDFFEAERWRAIFSDSCSFGTDCVTAEHANGDCRDRVPTQLAAGSGGRRRCRAASGAGKSLGGVGSRFFRPLGLLLHEAW